MTMIITIITPDQTLFLDAPILVEDHHQPVFCEKLGPAGNEVGLHSLLTSPESIWNTNKWAKKRFCMMKPPSTLFQEIIIPYHQVSMRSRVSMSLLIKFPWVPSLQFLMEVLHGKLLCAHCSMITDHCSVLTELSFCPLVSKPESFIREFRCMCSLRKAQTGNDTNHSLVKALFVFDQPFIWSTIIIITSFFSHLWSPFSED